MGRTTAAAAERITDCELGPIHHRPATDLLPIRRCRRGHPAPRYSSSGDCPACSKIRVHNWHERNPRPVSSRMRRFARYADAAAWHELAGGYLLRDPAGYAVTGSADSVSRRRGRAFLRRCDAVGCWDEVELSQPARLVAAEARAVAA